jgi:hypothetical protein
MGGTEGIKKEARIFSIVSHRSLDYRGGVPQPPPFQGKIPAVLNGWVVWRRLKSEGSKAISVSCPHKMEEDLSISHFGNEPPASFQIA